MFGLLFFIFLFWIFSEISLFVMIQGWVGLGWCFFWILGTAIVGTRMCRDFGIYRFFSSPAIEHMRSFSLNFWHFLAGFFLIIPTFLTDLIGFLLFMPVVQEFIEKYMIKIVMGQKSSFSFFSSSSYPQYSNDVHDDPSIIDVEYEDVNENKKS